MAFNRVKDCQRILQEDPEVINAWFKLVEETRQAYRILNKDIYNFNETGFIIGVTITLKVITSSNTIG